MPASPTTVTATQRLRSHDAFERVLQSVEFGVAADHARLDAFDAARGDAKRARLGAQHEVGDDRLVHALDLDAAAAARHRTRRAHGGRCRG